jgi:hypothetical protein
MKLQKFLTLFLLLALVLPVAEVKAQDELFLKSVEDSVPDYTSAEDAVKTGLNGGQFLRNSIIASRTYSSSKSVEADEENLTELRKTPVKESNVNYYNTFKGHMNGMQSDGIQKFMNEAGKAKIALFKYAQLQTEPSIATGSAMAQEFMFNLQHQILESDRAFRDQVNANPEYRDVVLATYNGCIKKQFEDPKMTMLLAISICQNDKIEEATAVTGFAEGDLVGVTLKADFHPARDGTDQLVTHSGLPAGVTSAASVSVIDSLINQAVTAGSIDGGKAAEFGEAFKGWFGDLLINFKDESGRRVAIKEARVAPTKVVEKRIDEMAAEKFNTLMKLLYKACTEKIVDSGTTSVRPAGQTTSCEAGSKAWYCDDSLKTDLRKISTPEFLVKFHHIEHFRQLVDNKETTDVNCEVFNKKVQSGGVDVGTASGTEVTDKDKFIDAYNIYYAYSHAVATQYMLWSFERALELTTRLAGAGAENPLKAKAYSLIEEQFGTLDFPRLRQENMAVMQILLTTSLFQGVAKETGTGGASIGAGTGR